MTNEVNHAIDMAVINIVDMISARIQRSIANGEPENSQADVVPDKKWKAYFGEYRDMMTGEVIQHGDAYWSEGKLVPSRNIGKPVGDLLRYRRRVVCDDKWVAEVVAAAVGLAEDVLCDQASFEKANELLGLVGVYRPDAPEEYRLMVPGDRRSSGQYEYRSKGASKWYPGFSDKVLTDYDCKVREYRCKKE